jgi:hypothetical protein
MEGDPMLMANVSLLDTLQPRAEMALRNSPVSELRALRVDRRDAALVISGTVSSFYHKQLAQEVVRAICKDCEVELTNTIRVR